MPKLDCNLLSISKLTKDLRRVTKFLPNLCEFYILESGKTIGNAIECGGLYYLQVESFSKELKVNSCTIVSLSNVVSPNNEEL